MSRKSSNYLYKMEWLHQKHCFKRKASFDIFPFKRKASFDIFMLFFLLLQKLFNIFLAKSSKNAQEVLSSMLHLSSLYSLYPPTFYNFRNFF